MSTTFIDINFGFCGDFIVGIVISDKQVVIAEICSSLDELEETISRELESGFCLVTGTYDFNYRLIGKGVYNPIIM